MISTFGICAGYDRFICTMYSNLFIGSILLLYFVECFDLKKNLVKFFRQFIFDLHTDL